MLTGIEWQTIMSVCCILLAKGSDVQIMVCSFLTSAVMLIRYTVSTEVYFQFFSCQSNKLAASRFCHLFASLATLLPQEEGVNYLNPCRFLGRAIIRCVPAKHKFTSLYWQTDRSVDLCKCTYSIDWKLFYPMCNLL